MQIHKFPGKPVFAIAIIEVQGHTFEFRGVNLQISFFVNVMLYVAISSATRPNSLKVLLPTEYTRQTRTLYDRSVKNPCNQPIL